MSCTNSSGTEKYFGANSKLKYFATTQTEIFMNLIQNIFRQLIEIFFRPAHSQEITHFLQFVKGIYQKLPDKDHINKIFDPRQPIKVKELSELNIEAELMQTFTITSVQTEKKTPESNSPLSYNLIPKAVLSLKVLQELPIIVVLMYQLYKKQVHNEVAEFIPLIMQTISLVPPQHLRQSPAFNKEVFVDFMGAQIKTLSFLAYIIRIYQNETALHSKIGRAHV